MGKTTQLPGEVRVQALGLESESLDEARFMFGRAMPCQADVVTALEDIIADAHQLGLRPWMALKERLTEEAIRIIARAEDRVVLQEGTALHFAHGSRRLSVDVDFVCRHRKSAGPLRAWSGPAGRCLSGEDATAALERCRTKGDSSTRPATRGARWGGVAAEGEVLQSGGLYTPPF